MSAGSQKVAEAIAAIKVLAGQKVVPARVKDELTQIAASLEPTRDRLEEIEDNYVIETRDAVDEGIRTAAQLWIESPPGHLNGEALKQIRVPSPLLSTLYKKGIDIERAFKYCQAETDIANWFGTRFEKTSDLLRAFRREKRSDKDPEEFSILVPNGQEVGNALNFLKNAGVIKGKKVLGKGKEGTWYPFRFENFRDDPDTRVLIVYTKTDQKLFRFLNGDWLSNYVYNIIHDQISRYDIPFELYSQVVYKAPPDVIRAGSDFDVIGRFQNTVICVECKSGRLDAERGDLEQIIQRTEDVRKILSTIGTSDAEFLFYAVVDPELNDMAMADQKFAGHMIKAIAPDRVRSEMAAAISRIAS